MPSSWTPEEIYEKVREVLTLSIDEVDPGKITINSHLANDLGAASNDFVDTYLRLTRIYSEMRTRVRPFSESRKEEYTVEGICKTIAELYSIEWITPELANA